jgi:hypothetical protein
MVTRSSLSPQEKTASGKHVSHKADEPSRDGSQTPRTKVARLGRPQGDRT